MQLSSGSASSSKRRDFQQKPGSRIKKKHKRLDAICEEEYTRNHAESNEGDGGSGSKDADVELRRSSRVRRAPVVLDVSPPPVKKRRKIGKDGKQGLNKSGKSGLANVKEEESGEAADLETPGSWRSRLRSRGRKLGVGVKKVEEKGSSSRRELFEETCEPREEEKPMVSELDGGKMMVVRSKRPGRVKATIGLRDREEVDLCGMKEEREAEQLEVRENLAEEDATDVDREVDGAPVREVVDNLVEGSPVVDGETDGANEMDAVENLVVEEGAPVVDGKILGGNEREMVDCNALVVDKGEERVVNGMQSEDNNVSTEEMERDEQLNAQTLQECQNEGTNQEDTVIPDEVELGSYDAKDDGLVQVDDKPLEGENAMMVDNSNEAAAGTLEKTRIKQGRRCGLCGGGTDGKPPKKLLQDTGESENEAYSSSASEEPNYDKWDGFDNEPGWLGRHLGPVNDRYGIARIWVHQNCAVWSPEVYFAGLGCLKNIRAALCRGRALKCSRCGRPGATIGCRVDRCPKTYHLPCARDKGCIFDHRKFLIACTDHRYLFQPQGNQYLNQIRKMKARKMRFEMRKVSNDAWRRDVEAEEKWLEHCGEDEEFLKRERKRLHRDMLRIAPTYIGGSDTENARLFEGWESVAGLQDVVRCLKEVVILPLLYPEFFNNMGLTPPRGVLLHGYPGTGKTLVVRALIGSCARGDKRIAYFARKGADCLGKYVGDAERQLRLLFQVAERCQPSIIFFDEIDGLAPCRTRQQDQTHNSVVSTLLALLDGLKSRGSVVVIGATNRPDAVDPALRRPGRFDREIYFPLPSLEDRSAILALHTRRWPKPVTGSLLKWVARQTPGFAGADLQALCTQAAVIALKRNFPLQEILSAAEAKPFNASHVPLPAFAVEERDWLEALSCAPPPCSRREAGIAAHDIVTSPLPTHLIPCFLRPLSTLLVSLHLDDHLWLPPLLSKGAAMVESVIVSALDDKRLPRDHWWSRVDDFLQEADVAKEIERRLSNIGIVIGEASFASCDAYSDNVTDDVAKFDPSVMFRGSLCANYLQDTSFGSRKKKGFRILIAGSPGSGQRHLASCLLQCFLGNIEIQKIDLATISQEGHGDLVQGVTQILMRCASVGSCVIFMPRVDLWALEKHQLAESDSSSTDDQHAMMEDSVPVENEYELAESTGCGGAVQSASCAPSSFVKRMNQVTGESGSPTDHLPVEENESSLQHLDFEEAKPQLVAQSASHAWSSFAEQVESICVSTSLMILATSEVPYLTLPDRIKQFFKSDSNFAQKTVSEYTVPRFSVHLGENINHDMVIKQSAAELSRDLIQLFIHLIHERSHVRADLTTNDFIQGYSAKLPDNVNNTSTNEVGVASQSCGNLSTEAPPPPPSNRILKVKSSLMVAISTFGYQILRYPHFAELCWITSKLKEGPCTDVRGPWKGWPFNTCIIRPATPLDEAAVPCGASNVKSKEKCHLVRGLVAVGLSAYRGEYSTLREVSFEVRKVLELLVGWINSKVNAGKDRYQYIRILSQVAYLDDMVNNWAYALQSLDHDVQMKTANPKPSILGSPDNCLACAIKPDQIEDCKPDVLNKSCPASQELCSSPVEVPDQNIVCPDLNKGDGDVATSPEGRDVPLKEASEQVGVPETPASQDLCSNPVEVPAQNIDYLDLNKADGDVSPSPGERDVPLEEASQQVDIRGTSSTEEHFDCSVIANPSINHVEMQNSSTPVSFVSKTPGNLTVVDEGPGSLQQSDEIAPRESIKISENGFPNSDELRSMKLSVPGEGCGQFNGSVGHARMTSDDEKLDRQCREDTNFSASQTAFSGESGVLCLYHCCSKCLCTLLSVMQKILVQDWKLDRSDCTVDYIHDTVASLSADLLSVVSKVYNAESSSNKFGESQRHGNNGELRTCHCRSTGNSLVMPRECSCHPIDGCMMDSENQFGFDPKFIFRDGVMVPLDSNTDISFHCKFETLCLCSLIESILMTKQPFD
ncbi:hypothetical protein SLEP1_g27118 [Rubroshorea leprosula]|uniref:PHD-type domain-containing protein n=1 Tax=Rubroshorea leprosula TaxID=152421 RepID=A0AAV5JPF2_9ROSI|nr:hypothetical protein SLEP1_g27118 [Rubroshorea leprosula]